MIYFDSSYLLKCYLAEPGHAVVRSLARQSGPVACGVLGKTECRAALHRHVREGKLSAVQAAQVHQVMQADDAAGLWVWLPLTDDVFQAANRVFEQLPASVFLRSADALHLACAQKNGFAEVYSNDRHLLAAAPHFGLVGKNVI
jgi:predicted nucleic acid-binding protein